MRAEKQNNFKKALSDISVADYDPTVKDIVKQCGISISTFYRWLSNPEKIKHPYRVVISNILNRDVTELFKNSNHE
jgi:transposase